MASARRPRLVLLSPLVVLASGHLVARIATERIGTAAWIPTVLVLWLLFAGFALWTLGTDGVRRALQPARGGLGWRSAAVLVGLLPLPIFLIGHRHLADPQILVAWLVFAAVNPLLEELYWRGALLGTAASRWTPWIAVPACAALFALNHPLSLGVFSLGNAHPATAISTFVLGVVWSIAWLRSQSLRAPWLGHVLTDLLNLSVVVFLNLYVPMIPGRGR